MQINYLIYITSFAQLVASTHYAYETIKGRTKPNRVTWFLWATAPLIATAAALSTGSKISSLPVFMAGFGPLIVFAASFVNKKSYWKLERFDYFCGLFSVLALLFWYLSKNPNIAILFSILSDGLAAVPTIRKSWVNPETETLSPYLVTAVSSALALFSVRSWEFSEWAFPAYLVFICTLFTLIILRRFFVKK